MNSVPARNKWSKSHFLAKYKNKRLRLWTECVPVYHLNLYITETFGTVNYLAHSLVNRNILHFTVCDKNFTRIELIFGKPTLKTAIE